MNDDKFAGGEVCGHLTRARLRMSDQKLGFALTIHTKARNALESLDTQTRGTGTRGRGLERSIR